VRPPVVSRLWIANGMSCPGGGEHWSIRSRLVCSALPISEKVIGRGLSVTLLVGDDWAEDHHDVEVLDETGRRLARARLDEGVAGMARLHELLAEHLDEDVVDAQTGTLAEGAVIVGIETDRGPWVSALVAAGYQVYVINPLSVARYRERHSTSGAKSDPGDAHVLAEIVRLDRAQPSLSRFPCKQRVAVRMNVSQGKPSGK
jgi:transposase